MTQPSIPEPGPRTRLAYRVPYADTDQMGVVYYANYFVYFERARNELLRELGLPYLEMERQGCQLPVIEANCRYHSPARYDDLLTLVAWPEAVSLTRIRVQCQVWRGDKLLAEGHTVHVCYAPAPGKAIRLPAALAPATRG